MVELESLIETRWPARPVEQHQTDLAACRNRHGLGWPDRHAIRHDHVGGRVWSRRDDRNPMRSSRCHGPWRPGSAHPSSEPGTDAESVVVLPLVTFITLALSVTRYSMRVASKSVPVIEIAVPGRPIVGVKLVMVGLPLSAVTVNGALLVAEPAGDVTPIGPVVAPTGTTTTNCVTVALTTSAPTSRNVTTFSLAIEKSRTGDGDCCAHRTAVGRKRDNRDLRRGVALNGEEISRRVVQCTWRCRRGDRRRRSVGRADRTHIECSESGLSRLHRGRERAVLRQSARDNEASRPPTEARLIERRDQIHWHARTTVTPPTPSTLEDEMRLNRKAAEDAASHRR